MGGELTGGGAGSLQAEEIFIDMEPQSVKTRQAYSRMRANGVVGGSAWSYWRLVPGSMSRVTHIISNTAVVRPTPQQVVQKQQKALALRPWRYGLGV